MAKNNTEKTDAKKDATGGYVFDGLRQLIYFDDALINNIPQIDDFNGDIEAYLTARNYLNNVGDLSYKLHDGQKSFGDRSNMILIDGNYVSAKTLDNTNVLRVKCTQTLVRVVDDKYATISLSGDYKQIQYLIGQLLDDVNVRDEVRSVISNVTILNDLVYAVVGKSRIVNCGVTSTSTNAVLEAIERYDSTANLSSKAQFFIAIVITKWLDIFEIRNDAMVKTFIESKDDIIYLDKSNLERQYARAHISDKIYNCFNKLKAANTPTNKRIDVAGYLQYLHLVGADIAVALTDFEFDYQNFEDIIQLVGRYAIGDDVSAYSSYGNISKLNTLQSISRIAAIIRIAVSSLRSDYMFTIPAIQLNNELEKFIRLIDQMPDYRLTSNVKDLIVISDFEDHNRSETKYSQNVIIANARVNSFDVDGYKYVMPTDTRLGFTDIRRDDDLLKFIIPTISDQVQKELTDVYALTLNNLMLELYTKLPTERIKGVIVLGVNKHVLLDAALMLSDYYVAKQASTVTQSSALDVYNTHYSPDTHLTFGFLAYNLAKSIDVKLGIKSIESAISVTDPILAILAGGLPLRVLSSELTAQQSRKFKTTSLTNRKSLYVANKELDRFISIEKMKINIPAIEGIFKYDIQFSLADNLTAISKFVHIKPDVAWAQLVSDMNSISDEINNKTKPSSRIIRALWRRKVIEVLLKWTNNNYVIQQSVRKGVYLLFNQYAKNGDNDGYAIQFSSLVESAITIGTVVSILNALSIASGGEHINSNVERLLYNEESLLEVRSILELTNKLQSV